MSILHNALKQASEPNQADRHTDYNPLANRSTAGFRINPYWLIGASFFCATLAVLFWPAAELAHDSTAAPIQEAHSDTEMVESAETIEPTPANNTGTVETAAQTVEVIPDIVSDGNDALLAPALLPPTEIEPEPAVTSDISRPQTQTQSPGIGEAKTTTTAATTAEVTPDPAPAAGKPVAATAPAADKPTKTESVATVKVTQTEPAAQSEPAAAATLIRPSATRWQTQVEAHIAAGELEQAEALLKNWIATLPQEKTPRIWLAQIYINNGFYLAAEPLLNDPSDSQMVALSGIIYERTERFTEAARVFERLHHNAPDNPKWLLFWAINSENDRQLVKAATLYQTYLTTFAEADSQLTAFARQRLDLLRRP